MFQRNPAVFHFADFLNQTFKKLLFILHLYFLTINQFPQHIISAFLTNDIFSCKTIGMPQNSIKHSMKGSKGHLLIILGNPGLLTQLLKTFLHFPGSRLGKGYHQNAGRIHLVMLQKRFHPLCHGGSFSGTGACQQHHGTLIMQDGFFLC